MGNSDATYEFERKVVTHCAPVLAGIKPAGMFSCPLKSASCCGDPHCRSLKPLDFVIAYQSCAERLRELDVEMLVLDQGEKSALVLVYRARALREAVSAGERGAFLESLGYETHDLARSLKRLAQRVSYARMVSKTKDACAFPHEVGIFLGYPVEDVIGFIENQGDDYLVCGCWKAYSRERDARACFCRYKQCTAELVRRFQDGARIEEIAALGSSGTRKAA